MGASGHVAVLGFLQFGIGFDPDVIRGETTIGDVAAPDASPWFMPVGASVLLPLIVGYMALRLPDLPRRDEGARGRSASRQRLTWLVGLHLAGLLALIALAPVIRLRLGVG